MYVYRKSMWLSVWLYVPSLVFIAFRVISGQSYVYEQLHSIGLPTWFVKTARLKYDTDFLINLEQ